MNTSISKILNGLTARGIDFETATEYGEPGYSTDKPLIVFANWNHLNKGDKEGFTRRSTMDAIEKHVEIEWSDEWTTGADNGKAYRTQPDCHGWTPYYIIQDDCEIVGIDELLADDSKLSDYLVSIENNDRQTVMDHISPDKLEELGYKEVEGDFQSGFHPGQTDKPADILARLLTENPEGRYIFRIDGKGQFDITFSVYQKIETPEEN